MKEAILEVLSEKPMNSINLIREVYSRLDMNPFDREIRKSYESALHNLWYEQEIELGDRFIWSRA